MIIHALHHPPEPSLAAALAEFETQFVYPLGRDRSFRISHGADYPRFFRAMGDARCFVAEAQGRVLGTLGVSIRELALADGSQHLAAYVGDIKIAPSARGGVVLHRLAQAAETWSRPQVTCAFGVVMDGTAALPETYTGRAGVPAFEKRGTLLLYRLPADATAADECVPLSPEQGQAMYKSLCRGRAFATPTDAIVRSGIVPEWIATADGEACGRLEDTSLAKRLVVDDGTELRSAHLACFAWRTSAAATTVISAARRRASRLGLPAVFVAVDTTDAAQLSAAVGVPSVTIAGATVYGVNLPTDLRWSISSSEI